MLAYFRALVGSAVQNWSARRIGRPTHAAAQYPERIGRLDRTVGSDGLLMLSRCRAAVGIAAMSIISIDGARGG